MVISIPFLRLVRSFVVGVILREFRTDKLKLYSHSDKDLSDFSCFRGKKTLALIFLNRFINKYSNVSQKPSRMF